MEITTTKLLGVDDLPESMTHTREKKVYRKIRSRWKPSSKPGKVYHLTSPESTARAGMKERNWGKIGHTGQSGQPSRVSWCGVVQNSLRGRDP